MSRACPDLAARAPCTFWRQTVRPRNVGDGSVSHLRRRTRALDDLQPLSAHDAPLCLHLHARPCPHARGAYTYARVPLGFEIAQFLGIHRNPYDKMGHFFQGFVPALVAREILIRGEYVRGRKMLPFVVICIALAISATYELIEWGATLALGQGTDEFLGTQGDPWDKQSDMFSALIGAIAALLFLSGIHNHQIQRLPDHAKAT